MKPTLRLWRPVVAWCVVCGLGLVVLPRLDGIIQARPFNVSSAYYALLDNGAHAAVAFLLWQLTLPDRTRTAYQLEAVASAAIASLLDLDHFVKAKSLSLQDATSLHERPPLHSLTTCVILLALVCIGLPSLLRSLRQRVLKRANNRTLLTHTTGKQPPPPLQNEPATNATTTTTTTSTTTNTTTMMWVCFALGVSAVFSHHIRDAHRRGLWLGITSPHPTVPVSYPLYLACLIAQATALALLGLVRTSLSVTHPHSLLPLLRHRP